MADATKAQDLRGKTDAELNELLKSTHSALFKARFENFTNRLDSTAKIRLLRRDIARIQTVINEKRRAGKTPAKAEG